MPITSTSLTTIGHNTQQRVKHRQGVRDQLPLIQDGKINQRTDGLFHKAFQVAEMVQESACNAGGLGSIGKIPWRRASQPTPVFLPGESHEQSSLVGHSPWGHKESDTTK